MGALLSYKLTRRRTLDGFQQTLNVRDKQPEGDGFIKLHQRIHFFDGRNPETVSVTGKRVKRPPTSG